MRTTFGESNCSVAPGDGRIGGSSRSRSRSSAASRALSLHLVAALSAHHVDGQLDKVADHRLDVAADVADLGELRRFDLDERRLRELRQAAGDFGLADAGRADHQDVLRRDFVGDLRRQPLPSNAIAKRNRDRALGLRLADDVLVELGDDLARRQRALAVRCVREKIAMSSATRHEDGADSDALQSSSMVQVECWCKCRCPRRCSSTPRRSGAPTACCASPALSPPPWQTVRPIPPPRSHRPVR